MEIEYNDLIFVPNANEIRFQSLSVTNVVNGANVVTVYTEAQQQQAYEAFINQDSYLSTRRGQYVERNGLVYLMLILFICYSRFLHRKFQVKRIVFSLELIS
jgi:hypothetical protein